MEIVPFACLPFDMDPADEPMPAATTDEAELAEPQPSAEPRFLNASIQLVRPTENGEDIVATIAVSTNLPEYSRSSFTTSRTLAEFDRLHLHLTRSRPECIAPAAPPKSTNLLFLRKTLGRFLVRISQNPVLRVDEATRTFFESTFQSLFSFVSSSSSSKEIDVYFENAKLEIGTIEAYYSAVGRINERIDLGRSSLEVSSKLGSLGLEKPAALVVQLRKISKGFAAEDDVLTQEAQYRQGVLNDQCLLLLRANMGARESMNYRMEALAEYDASCKVTQRKVQAIERLRMSSSIRQDKVDAALDDLAETKRVEAECRDTFKRLSDMLRKEYNIHRVQRTDDVADMLDEHDPFISNILDTSSHVTVYDFDPKSQAWNKKGIEGTMFVFQRTVQPMFGFLVMNRLSTDSLIVSLTSQMQFEMLGEYLMYKLHDGLWVFEAADRERLAAKLSE
eukprot:jgi/Hompol1/321/HPOL_003959-RA